MRQRPIGVGVGEEAGLGGAVGQQHRVGDAGDLAVLRSVGERAQICGELEVAGVVDRRNPGSRGGRVMGCTLLCMHLPCLLRGQWAG